MIGAGEAPGNVKTEAISSTEIYIQWKGPSTCRLLNGLIVKYQVQFDMNCTNAKPSACTASLVQRRQTQKNENEKLNIGDVT